MILEIYFLKNAKTKSEKQVHSKRYNHLIRNTHKNVNDKKRPMHLFDSGKNLFVCGLNSIGLNEKIP
jgi:hypothetical protein